MLVPKCEFGGSGLYVWRETEETTETEEAAETEENMPHNLMICALLCPLHPLSLSCSLSLLHPSTRRGPLGAASKKGTLSKRSESQDTFRSGSSAGGLAPAYLTVLRHSAGFSRWLVLGGGVGI